MSVLNPAYAVDVTLLAASFIPGLLYLSLLARYDRFDREPRRYLICVFVFGMFAVIPAALLELLVSDLIAVPLLGGVDSPVAAVIFAFFAIGPIEEICKFMAVKVIYEGEHFKDPLDGVVYATAAAMGFASLENAFYVQELGWGTFWVRAGFAIPGHMIFSAMWGYQLGRRKFGLGGSLALGIAVAAFLHGLYDALLVSTITWLAVLVIPLMLIMLWLFRRRIRELREMSKVVRGTD